MSDRLGTAQWQDDAVVSQRYPFTEGKFWLGRAADDTPIGYRDDRHICLVSGNRGGKGTSLIVNNLCFWPGSAVVVDPKGENATVTAARRGQGSEYCEGMGQTVRVLDPFNATTVDESYRSCFNPLADLDPQREETIDEASRLANAIVIVKDERADPFWDESARSMVRGLILHVLTAEQFTGIRNLVTVRNLVQRGAWEIAEVLRNMGKEQIDPPHLLLWRSMELNPVFDSIVAGIGTQFRSMMESSPKTFQGVLQSVANNTEFIDSPGMRRILAKSDFKLSELKTRREGMTLYLSLPQRYMDTHYRWLRMMVALTTAEMEMTRGQPASGHPVLLVLDEFAGLKRMAAIENAVAQIAGFGVKLFFVLQSLEQLKATYKDHWETFLANAGLKIFFSIEDHFTQDYVSKLIGETEIIRELHSTNENESQNESSAEGRSQSQSRSQSTMHGKSQSDMWGKSFSTTDNTSRSKNSSNTWGENESETEGESDTRGTGATIGTGQTQGWSTGSSSGMSSTYGPGGGSTTYSRGGQSGLSGSQSINSSSTASTSRSKSHSTMTGTSKSFTSGLSDGTSHSDTKGGSYSRTGSTSQSETWGNTDTHSTSQTHTTGRSRGQGRGSNESLHRRLLIQPDEIGRHFARKDDRRDPFFPGLALVLVAGTDPLMVRRTHYFEDPFFIDCFSSHPDHPFVTANAFGLRGKELQKALTDAMVTAKLTIGEWLITPGEVVQPGEVMAVIRNVPPDNRTVSLYMPYFGKVSTTAATPENRLPSGQYALPGANNLLLAVKNYPSVTQNYGVDPFRDIHALRRPKPVQLEAPLSDAIAKIRPLEWLGVIGCMGIAALAVLAVVIVFAYRHC